MAKLPNREAAARREAPVPSLTTTGRPADQQRDTSDRACHIRFELSPKTLMALILVVASFWLLIQLWPVLLVLVVALLVAGTMSPAVRWLEARRVGRGFSIAIVFTILFILGILFVVLTIPTLMSQAGALLQDVPALRARLTDYLASFPLTAPLATWLRGLKADALTGAISATPFDFPLRVFGVVAYGLSALFLGLYIIIDRDRLRGWLFALVPRSHHIRLSRIMMDIETIVGAYIRGQMLTSLLMSVFTFVLLTVCGVENASSLKARFYELDDGELLGVFAPLEEHQSYPGRLHGGISAAVLDESTLTGESEPVEGAPHLGIEQSAIVRTSTVIDELDYVISIGAMMDAETAKPAQS